MARGKAKEVPVEKPIDTPKYIEVELSDNYSNSSAIMMKHQIIDFTDGKAKVSQETAQKLKEQGFVK